jgi:hypothetical protein
MQHSSSLAVPQPSGQNIVSSEESYLGELFCIANKSWTFYTMMQELKVVYPWQAYIQKQKVCPMSMFYMTCMFK